MASPGQTRVSTADSMAMGFTHVFVICSQEQNRDSWDTMGGEA
jgi:hypothetical protein